MTTPETAPRRRPMRQLPALVPRDDHEEIRRLASDHGRGVGAEYRAAVAAWIAAHRQD